MVPGCEKLHVFEPHDFTVLFYEAALVSSNAAADEWNKRGIDSPRLINVLSTLAWRTGDVSHVKPLARIYSTDLSWDTLNFIWLLSTKKKLNISWPELLKVGKLKALGRFHDYMIIKKINAHIWNK